jgi:SAM-dependent methyltransferase
MTRVFAWWAERTHGSLALYDFRRSLMATMRRLVGRIIGDDADDAVQEMWSRYQACCTSVMAGASVLDVGCGPGEHSEEVLKSWHAARYAGIDLSVGMVRDARRRYPEIDFVAANACQLPLPNSSFDVVTSSFIFHHIPVNSRVEALHEQLRVGNLVLLRDLFGMEGGLRSWLYRLYYMVFDGSEYRFTLHEWHEFLVSAGADVLSEGHSRPDVIRNRHCFFLMRKTESSVS